MMRNNNEKKTFPFSTLMDVRITDINYGMHLGHVALAGLLHNARVLFLKKNQFDEMNIEGNGLILLKSQYTFKNEATFNTKLIVSVGIGEHTKAKFNFIYEVSNKETGSIIAEGSEEVACFNYNKKKIVKIPDAFLQFCKENQIICPDILST
jgi:acyl-CoA thioester hydrolase